MLVFVPHWLWLKKDWPSELTNAFPFIFKVVWLLLSPFRFLFRQLVEAGKFCFLEGSVWHASKCYLQGNHFRSFLLAWLVYIVAQPG